LREREVLPETSHNFCHL